MIIAQITDLHVSTPDSRIEQEFLTSRYLARAVAHINALTPQPDVVLATGDLVERGGIDEYQRLRDILSPLIRPLYLIPGNHDHRDHLRAVFDDHDYLPDDGFLHYCIDDHPVRLIGLDTQIPGQSGGTLCRERLSWLDRQLTRRPDQPTLLFMHHPPFRTGLNKMDEMGFDDPGPLATIVERHPQVERIVAGHIHRPITRRFAGTVVTVGPSTAHQIQLDLASTSKLASVMEPPAVLLHAWLPDDAGLVSHTSYVDSDFEVTPLFDGKQWITAPKTPAAAG